MYTIDGTKVTFNCNTIEGEALRLPDYVTEIDFNNVERINVTMLLGNTNIKELDLKDIITVQDIIVPDNTIVKEKLYWAGTITGVSGPLDTYKVHSKRLKRLNVYDNRAFAYLSGTIKGFLPLREFQRTLLEGAFNWGVYDPGNHITFGDPVADKNPDFVYELDILALERANIIVFDLNNLSAGTCAELGYVMAKNWQDTKRIIAIYEEPITNFFIKGLVEHPFVERYHTIQDLVEEHYDENKKVK